VCLPKEWCVASKCRSVTNLALHTLPALNSEALHLLLLAKSLVSVCTGGEQQFAPLQTLSVTGHTHSPSAHHEPLPCRLGESPTNAKGLHKRQQQGSSSPKRGPRTGHSKFNIKVINSGSGVQGMPVCDRGGVACCRHTRNSGWMHGVNLPPTGPCQPMHTRCPPKNLNRPHHHPNSMKHHPGIGTAPPPCHHTQSLATASCVKCNSNGHCPAVAHVECIIADSWVRDSCNREFMVTRVVKQGRCVRQQKVD